MTLPHLCYRAFEFRGEPGDGRTLEGYAAVFNTPTRIDSWEGTFDEQIARGAFAKTIAERKPVLQFDHGRDARTGSVPIGAIEELREDKTGLFVQADLFDNAVVEPIRQAIAGDAITGMSFRFKVTRDEWRDNAGKLVKPNELPNLLWQPGDRGPLKRTIREVELFELGPVVFPAYHATTVGVRSVLTDLDAGERQALIAELAAELRAATDLSDAGQEATSATTPDAGQEATSATTPDAGQEATSGSPTKHAAARLALMEWASRDVA